MRARVGVFSSCMSVYMRIESEQGRKRERKRARKRECETERGK